MKAPSITSSAAEIASRLTIGAKRTRDRPEKKQNGQIYACEIISSSTIDCCINLPLGKEFFDLSATPKIKQGRTQAYHTGETSETESEPLGWLAGKICESENTHDYCEDTFGQTASEPGQFADGFSTSRALDITQHTPKGHNQDCNYLKLAHLTINIRPLVGFCKHKNP
jgi:hypothetical protein